MIKPPDWLPEISKYPAVWGYWDTPTEARLAAYIDELRAKLEKALSDSVDGCPLRLADLRKEYGLKP